MKILSKIIISRPEGNASIQLLHGDLTAIPPEFAVDILAVSAFQKSYEPNPDTLMGALANAGISVADLAKDKEIDLLAQLSCWLSKPLSETQQARFNFKKILCFEPVGKAEDAETQVGNLFRGINTFAMDDNHDEIAMPVLATGNQQFPLETMLSALLDTAIFWLENGLPLKSLKFVLYRDDQVEKGLPIFDNVQEQYELKKSAEAGHISASQALTEISALNESATKEYALPKMEYALQELNQQENEAGKTQSRGVTRGASMGAPSGSIASESKKYDYFISYSHKHTAAVQEFVSALKAQNPALTIFYDRDTIPTGGLWIKMISDAIQNSRNVICILTPEYSQSKVCWDEFQCAYVMEGRKKLMIRTINFCNDENLPPMMAIYSYIDCTEGDLEKLKGAVARLVER
jgi:hypothetical protein